MGFSVFNFDPRISAGIRALGYTSPTPIQAQSIAPILQGRDVMGLAQTGTGKTAAFALPILQRLLSGPRGVTRALVLAPTRELADQIQDAFRDLGRQTGLRSATVYGGVGAGPQISSLRNGVEIIVACPGRLLDHLQQGAFKPSRLEVLVLDEADRMFDMGFLPDIRRILKHLPAHRQTLLFSATMPDDIRKLAHEVLRQPITVQAGHTVPLATVTHALYPVVEHLKSALLTKLLEQTGGTSVLIFTRTKHRAKRLAQRLNEQNRDVTCLQGNLSQSQRKAALEGFREGRFNILVATDIASRGIDISQITHVINFDIPDTTEAYTHRIGRTGRAAKTGDAFTLVTQQDEAMVRDIERAMGVRLERRKIEGFDYSAKQPAGTPQGGQRGRQPGHGHGHGHHHPKKTAHAPQPSRPAHSSHAAGGPGHSTPAAKPASGFHGRFGRLRSRRRRR
ncbi:MAG: DEAD/DEAH box helicase [Elusimicrobia bacterium]|nr:DEAD/DEAH box helicase [Elusimicrobiota bacterium]